MLVLVRFNLISTPDQMPDDEDGWRECRHEGDDCDDGFVGKWDHVVRFAAGLQCLRCLDVLIY